MNVWHLTPETPREPSRVTPGSPVHLRIGTWPIEPGQEVAVEFSVTSWSGRMAEGLAQARWVENQGENSYWTATFGPFADGGWYDVTAHPSCLMKVSADEAKGKYDAKANSAQPIPARGG